MWPICIYALACFAILLAELLLLCVGCGWTAGRARNYSANINQSLSHCCSHSLFLPTAFIISYGIIYHNRAVCTCRALESWELMQIDANVYYTHIHVHLFFLSLQTLVPASAPSQHHNDKVGVLVKRKGSCVCDHFLSTHLQHVGVRALLCRHANTMKPWILSGLRVGEGQPSSSPVLYLCPPDLSTWKNGCWCVKACIF